MPPVLGTAHITNCRIGAKAKRGLVNTMVHKTLETAAEPIPTALLPDPASTSTWRSLEILS